jgi:hypothetical protein
MQGRNRERMSAGDFLDQAVLAALFGRLNEGFPHFGADPREVAGASSYESPCVACLGRSPRSCR